jgi:hypothetical protein
VYSILLSICISTGLIDPQGSIIQNVVTGFFIWVIPQLVVYFFLRGRDFGFGKRWIIQGVIYAAMLTLFLNEGIIDPSGSYSMNLIAGIAIYVGSYLGGVLLN